MTNQPNKIEEATTEWWGQKCPDYEKGCPICDAWKEYETLQEKIRILDEAVDNALGEVIPPGNVWTDNEPDWQTNAYLILRDAQENLFKLEK